MAFLLTNAFAMPKAVTTRTDKHVLPEPVVMVQTEVEDNVVYAPVDGQAMPLAKLPDPVFSSGMMGQGPAIEPAKDGVLNVLAPQQGHISLVADTGHAYGLITDQGIELLLHIGIDTVNLKGKGFTTAVTVGQEVSQGTVLGTVDIAQIKAAGLNPAIMTIVTNTPDFDHIEVTGQTKLAAGDPMLTLQKAIFKKENDN
ncbi:sucrose PTS, EIIBCA [Weissella halotolerans DSM 20190]|uniref:Sucrose PTS, EIIBCA n=1 Tax=Weissella halotolerans DSM 20190 TaxID=1123500 RepID=A0A0R2FVJ6_9LACO|nr:sucrose PTS, EIIBCA [Weissella halotolerans DSM 20190]